MSDTPSIVQPQSLFESLRDNELINYLRTTNEAAEATKHRLDAAREAIDVDEAAALNAELNALSINCRRIEAVLRDRQYSDEQIKAFWVKPKEAIPSGTAPVQMCPFCPLVRNPIAQS